MGKNLDMSGFSKLTRRQRIEKLWSLGFIHESEARFLLSETNLDPELAEHFIENVIGYFQLPLGVATNFCIDGVDYAIPMAVEETSIIAAACNTAKWVKGLGSITTRTLGSEIIGQIQIAKTKNIGNVRIKLPLFKEDWIRLANQVAEGLVRRGGGVKDILLREIIRPDGDVMAVLHVLADPKDAMGANIMNQICEALRPVIEEKLNEKVTMCILSNLVDTKLTEASIEITNIDPEIGHGIEEASLFAQLDPYRAATNNKGILNGIDGIIVATGNDWRAVEAGMHAYAARDGQYRSLSTWKMRNGALVGTLCAPIVVGTVGGVTRLHPTARMCLGMMKIQSSEHLSRVMAAVGLVQNLGALKALSTVGIVQGHMKLHATNLALAAGANSAEIPHLREELEAILKIEKKITLSKAQELLEKVRLHADLSP